MVIIKVDERPKPKLSKTRINPTLYAINLDKPKWEEKYIQKQTRVHDWDSIVKIEETAGINRDLYTWPLFTEDFCKEMIEEVENLNQWTVARHEYYPTTDVTLSEINYHGIYEQILQEYGYPVARHVWGLTGSCWTEQMYSENFLAKYSPETQGHLDSHIDGSRYSITLALNSGFTGGGTWYHRQQKLISAPVGSVCLFPMPTHKHSGTTITSGTRYIIVSFCQNPDIPSRPVDNKDKQG
tara:strand:- start:67 stop:786 length:720 start_codon:yes stop_codon:yes gene_type:complete